MIVREEKLDSQVSNSRKLPILLGRKRFRKLIQARKAQGYGLITGPCSRGMS